MRLPPDLEVIGVDIQTNAVPNTNTQVNMLALAGAGFRYRIWSLGIAYNSTGGVMVQKLRVIWQDSTGPAVIWTQSMAAEAGGSLFSLTDHFDGGLALSPNARLQFHHSDSIASLFWRMQATYTKEPVT